MKDETQSQTDVGCIEVMDDAMVEVLRHKTGFERLQISWKMWSSARRMLTSHLSGTHPDWSAAP